MIQRRVKTCLYCLVWGIDVTNHDETPRIR